MIERSFRLTGFVDGDVANDLKDACIKAGPISGTWRSIEVNEAVVSLE